MSVEKRQLEARRWLAQARDDWEAGEALLRAEKYPQAAFLAQQSGEKGLWIALGHPWGHSLTRLIYIPTRYPDALPGLTPEEARMEEVRLGQG